jgi:hypothetical protein
MATVTSCRGRVASYTTSVPVASAKLFRTSAAGSGRPDDDPAVAQGHLDFGVRGRRQERQREGEPQAHAVRHDTTSGHGHPDRVLHPHSK